MLRWLIEFVRPLSLSEHMKFKRLFFVAALLLILFVGQAVSLVGSDAEAKGKKAKARVSKKVKPYPPEFGEAIGLVLIEKKYKEAFDIFSRLDRTGFCRDKTHYHEPFVCTT